MKSLLRRFCIALSMGSIALLPTLSQGQEVTLRAVNAFQEGTYYARNFEEFVKTVNEEGKGLIQINYLGGPKAISPAEHGTAFRRGVIDLANTTASYTANLVPEGMVLNFTPLSMQELREQGVVDYLNTLYEAKGMYYLGRTGEGIPYQIYTNKKVEKMADIAGQKLRVAPIYRDFFQALGATMLQTQAGEVYTALERGAVDGYGWPLIGTLDFGWQEKTKYLVQPGFYMLEVGMVMSKSAWDKLNTEQKEFLNKRVAALEAANVSKAQADGKKEIELLKQAGVQVLTLPEDEQAQFLRLAYSTAWEGMEKISPKHAKKLRELSHADELIK